LQPSYRGYEGVLGEPADVQPQIFRDLHHLASMCKQVEAFLLIMPHATTPCGLGYLLPPKGKVAVVHVKRVRSQSSERPDRMLGSTETS
jgi:hypothetical protein